MHLQNKSYMNVNNEVASNPILLHGLHTPNAQGPWGTPGHVLNKVIISL